MTSTKGIKKICKEGHTFYKSSECLSCPICDKNNKPEEGFLALLSAPARRAFEQQKLATLKKVAQLTTQQILALHGVGPSTIPILQKVLKENGMIFKAESKTPNVKKSAAKVKPATVDAYIKTFPPATQKHLKNIREEIKKLIPGAEEKISYAMPSFHYNGKYVIYYAGYKNHIGLYPIPTGDKQLNDLYKNFDTSGKATIKFPLDEPLPIDLIKKIVEHRMASITKSKK